MTSPDLWPALLTLGVLAGMLALFVSELYPPEVVAVGGAAVLLATGVLPADDLHRVFSNPAPITIGAMFILSGALIRTGALNTFTGMALRRARSQPRRTLGGFAAFVVGASAFMNNTPIVVMLIPIASQLAHRIGATASQLLIPLSYLGILGGTCTLIGTSTNLLVDGVARGAGLAPFGLFEITPIGLAAAVSGLVYLAVFGRRLLPRREAMTDFLVNRPRQRFLTEVAIPEGSDVVGKKVTEVADFRRDGMRVVDVLRGDESLRRNMGAVELHPGDRVVLRAAMEELMDLKQSKALAMVDLSSKRSVLVEALIGPDSRMIGRQLGPMRLRRRYGVYPIAAHRRSRNVGGSLDNLVVRVGDTILLEGAPEDIRRLADDMRLTNLAQPTARAYRRERAPLVMAVVAAVVVLAAFDVAPISVLSVIGVAAVLLTRCIDADEAFGFIEGRLLVLIFSMLAIGAALQRTGAVALIVDAATPALADLPPWVVLYCVYLLSTVLTELVSNNAVAIVVTPIAIGLAQAIGVDPRPFVVAVMIAASASFATPIGYQTNTLVYAPGGYKFTDYLRIGAPLNLLVGVVATALIPFFWPF